MPVIGFMKTIAAILAIYCHKLHKFYGIMLENVRNLIYSYQIKGVLETNKMSPKTREEN